MARMPLLIPTRYNADAVPAQLAADEAQILRNADLRHIPGRLLRGRGAVRCMQVDGTTNRVQSAGVWQPRGCQYLLVDGLANGTVRWHAGDGAQAQYGATRCFGPLPEYIDCEREGECYGCQPIFTPTWADADVVITNADIGLAGVALTSAVERYVRFCECSEGAKYDPRPLRITVDNQSDSDVALQFYWDVEGLAPGNNLRVCTPGQPEFAGAWSNGDGQAMSYWTLSAGTAVPLVLALRVGGTNCKASGCHIDNIVYDVTATCLDKWIPTAYDAEITLDDGDLGTTDTPITGDRGVSYCAYGEDTYGAATRFKFTNAGTKCMFVGIYFDVALDEAGDYLYQRFWNSGTGWNAFENSDQAGARKGWIGICLDVGGSYDVACCLRTGVGRGYIDSWVYDVECVEAGHWFCGAYAPGWGCPAC